MIRYTTGNLRDADVEALVNTVNTVGVMGKGVALMFKEAFPDNFRAYAAACERGEVDVGRMFVTETEALMDPRWIINFPTKQHWPRKTRIAWVDSGLADLRRVIEQQAFGPLPCRHWVAVTVVCVGRMCVTVSRQASMTELTRSRWWSTKPRRSAPPV